MNLFVTKSFIGAAGLELQWKVECDALTDEDWAWAAARISERVKFGPVEGVPTGGLKLAAALERYSTPGRGLLIVDDVLTTGISMEMHRAGRDATGYVLFARGRPARWIRALWTLDA